jgi:hypothetical protein
VTSDNRLISTVRVTGRHPGRWRLLVDSSLVCSGRVGSGILNDTLDLVPREKIPNGSSVELKFESLPKPNTPSDIDYLILGADL